MASVGGDPGWRAGPALHRAVLVVGVLLAAALVSGKAELVGLAAPLLAGTVFALLAGAWPGSQAGGGHRPDLTGSPVATATAPRVASQGARVQVRVDVVQADGGELAVVRVPGRGGFPHGRVVATGVRDGHASIPGEAVLPRWGAVTVARPDLLVAGPDALTLHGPSVAFERWVAVLPTAEKVPAAPLPPRAAGLVGVHRTRRPGEGSELLDVREFRAGDRMRRIDWRVSARRGVLHVRRTAVDADAEIVLCLDTRYDVSADVATWPHPPGLGSHGTSRAGSSLDLTVRAAGSLAETFLRQGDRVSVVDLTRPQLSVPRGTGVRHLRRIRRQLVEVGVHLHARKLLLRPGSVPPSALVVLLSPMLDEAAADLAASLRRRGREVMVLDALPHPLQPPRRSRSELLAHRLLQAERDVRLGSLRRHGVLVTRWDPMAVPVLLRQRARERRGVA